MDMDYYELDKYLNMIGYSIQLPDNKRKEISDSYKAVAEYINNNNDLAEDVDVSIYYHGSFAIDTVIKPIKGEDFDLDIVVEFDSSKKEMSANKFYNSFLETFKDGRYGDMVEEYRNSVRLNYESNYHFDIMPSVPLRANSHALYVPDAKKHDWVIRSPKTYIDWFMAQTSKIKGYKIKSTDSRRLIMESEVTPLKSKQPYEVTPTLIRVVQLIKRIKDVFFHDYTGEREPQSIVITTLAAKYYNGEYSVYEALSNIIKKMKQLYDNNSRFMVANPSYSTEVFTEKWPKHIEYYTNYQKFVNYAFVEIGDLLKPDKAKKAFRNLFGQHPFDDVYEQTKHDHFWNQQPSNITKGNVFPDEQVRINKKERGNA